MNFEISKNICEICRQKATAGILDETKDEDDFGFLNLKLENNGTKIVGEFHSNDANKIIDHFEIVKQPIILDGNKRQIELLLI